MMDYSNILKKGVSIMISTIEKLYMNYMVELTDGKFIFDKNSKFNVSNNTIESVKKSVDKSIISDVERLITRENVDIEDKKCNTNITSVTTPMLVSSILYINGHQNVPTLIYLVPKKLCKNGKKSGVRKDRSLQPLFKYSSFGLCYDKLEEEWVNECKNNKSGNSSILYVPDVIIFNKLFTQFNLFKINVLLLAVDKARNTENVIMDIVESSVKLNCRTLLVEPFGIKQLSNDIYETSKLWSDMASTKTFNNKIDDILFIVDGDNFIILQTTLNNAILSNIDRSDDVNKNR